MRRVTVSQDAIVKPDIIRGSDRAFFLRGFRVFISTYLMPDGAYSKPEVINEAGYSPDRTAAEPWHKFGQKDAILDGVDDTLCLAPRSWVTSQPQTSDDGSGQHEN